MADFKALPGVNLEEFYQELEDAVVREQLERGLEEVRRRILKKAA